MRLRVVLIALFALLLVPAAALGYGRGALTSKLAHQMRYVRGASSAYAVDLTTQRVLYSRGAGALRNPASVEKLYTTSTALIRMGPAATFTTTVLGNGTLDASGIYRGNLWLHGDGDPMLTSTQVAGLARQLAALHIKSVHGSVLGDGSIFDGLLGSYETGGGLDSEIGALGGLDVDHGWTNHGMQTNPALYAAQRLSAALRAIHVKVTGRTGTGVAPAGARTYAAVSSAPLSTLVAETMIPSDNYAAETLLKDLGARFGGAGTTAAGAAVVRAEAARIGLYPQIVDGSGLSRADRTSPLQVVRLLWSMERSPLYATFSSAMPLAGVSGTLAHRMRHTAAWGRCHAKTGTLSDVSALAGYCPSRDGHLIAFALLMNRVSVWRAHRAQDRMVEALAGATL